MNILTLRGNGDLARACAAIAEHFERLTPAGALRVVDLAEIEHLTLYHPALAGSAILDDAPVAVLFAVFAAGLGAQEHASSVWKN